MNRPVLIVDGLNLFVRHFVVNPTLSDSGDHVGGMVGFLRALAHLSSRTMPSRIFVVWEAGGSPRRRAIYKNYKHNRRPQKLNRYYLDDIPDTVENRNDQISNLIRVLKCVPVDQIYIEDCEADDIIGYMVRNLLNERCVIASSDRDLYQLLNKTTIQWSPGQKKFITCKDVESKFGVTSDNFCTARCFVGDSSDGLSGVPRAGFASMSKRFPELLGESFVSVSDIIESAEEKSKDSNLKIYRSICENSDIPKRNWKLMYLDTNNLSAGQIQKIEKVFENPYLNSNKLDLIRSMSNLGIKNFDIDSFYSSVSSTRKNYKNV